MDVTEPSNWALLVVASDWAIRLAMLAVIPVRRSPDAAKGWLLLVFFLPWVGLLLYLAIGRPRLPRWRIERNQKVRGDLVRLRSRLMAHPAMIPSVVEPRFEPTMRLAERLAAIPPLTGNGGEILIDYDVMVERLVADVDAARDHVHLLYYLFADDATGRRVIEALGRARRRGVECRVLYDSMGSRPYRRGLRRLFAAAGVEAHESMHINWLQRGRVDLRNHRKIAVIDGHLAYTGSQNIVDASFKKGLTYEELSLRVAGPVVLGLQAVFIKDWHQETGETLIEDRYFPAPRAAGSLIMQALPSGPDYPLENTQRSVVALVYAARSRVVITTPYFVPDQPLLQALQAATCRGVEVHLIVNHRHDQILVGLAQRSYYEELLEAGIRIHLYRGSFLHAKHMTVDDDVALIGSSNMDIRSFMLNAEISLLLYDEGVVGRLRKEHQRCFEQTDRLDLETWRRRPLVRKVAQNIARLLSPLL